MTPIRIQRSRKWKQVSPNGLPIVYVGRPGKWGNPFKIQGDMIYGKASHRRGMVSLWVYIEPDSNDFINWGKDSLNEIVIKLYVRWLDGKDNNYTIPPPSIEEIKTKLKGKNLSCWCKIGEKCHADVLLELVNK